MANSESFWLRSAVLEHIANNSGKVNSVDIVTHFKLRVDITLNEVAVLEEEEKIRRVWNGREYVYELVVPDSKSTTPQ